jgi:hypothetical protein
MALVSTQPLTEIFLGVKSGRRVGLTTLPPSISRMSENVGASTSRNPKGLHGLYRDKFTLPLPASTGILFVLFFDAEDGNGILLRNITTVFELHNVTSHKVILTFFFLNNSLSFKNLIILKIYERE